jgi:TIR domain-containing protein
VDEALQAFDTFVLVWSENAAASSWVRAELEVALTRRIEESDIRVIPVRLDGAPLPAFLRPLKYLEIGAGVPAVVDAIMGFSNDRDRLRAISAGPGRGRDLRYRHSWGRTDGRLPELRRAS